MSYIERYRGGERIEVWEELLELGAAIDDTPLRDEAWAVACEAMRRLRRTLEAQVTILRELGYAFAAEQPLPPSAHDAPARLGQLEQLLGGVPPALRAFYGELDGVDLRGAMPGWNPPGPLRANSPRLGVLDSEHCFADPLCVAPLAALVDEATQRTDELAQLSPDEGLLLSFADDFVGKEGRPGGLYGLLLPEKAIDTDVEVYRPTTFVSYLREALGWGGFPGWAHYSNPPRAVIERLRDGLVPF